MVGDAGELREHLLDRTGDLPEGADLVEEHLPLGEGGQLAVEEEVPDVFEGAGLGQLDRVVLAVVVEALEAADVTDVGLGDDDTFQTAGDLVGQ